MRVMMRAISVSLVVILPLAVGGCGTTTTSRTASGTVMGAAGGAALGAIGGNAALGAAAGAGAGLIGGFLYDQYKKGNID